MEYLRIGTGYYKEVNEPTLNEDTVAKIINWNRSTILDDFGKEYLKKIPKYEGFTVNPSHLSYKPTIKGFYNKYRPLSHDIGSKIENFEFENTVIFLKHIFGEQYELGIDYLTILFQKPLQILPILCLVSEERNTGKTTFLNWLKMVFEDNMTINKNEDFRSRFNSDWSEKLIVAVDEVLLDRKEDSERIKNLSTAQTYKTEAKGIDKRETNFFGKFILCSNNETNFILIDEKEIRYWVRKIPQLDKVNANFVDELYQELPNFVNYLAHRPIKHRKLTRMWFTKTQIHTEALDKLVYGTKYYFEKELILILQEKFAKYEIDTISLGYEDIKDQFKDSSQRVSRREIVQVVVDKWKLKLNNNSYYKFEREKDPITNKWRVIKTSDKGRFYTFEKEFIESLLKC